MRSLVGTRVDAPVAVQNHTWFPMLSRSLVTRRVPAALRPKFISCPGFCQVLLRMGLVPSIAEPPRAPLEAGVRQRNSSSAWA
eukprot:187252-Pyramimonas_sp.AAC.1